MYLSYLPWTVYKDADLDQHGNTPSLMSSLLPQILSGTFCLLPSQVFPLQFYFVSK